MKNIALCQKLGSKSVLAWENVLDHYDRAKIIFCVPFNISAMYTTSQTKTELGNKILYEVDALFQTVLFHIHQLFNILHFKHICILSANSASLMSHMKSIFTVYVPFIQECLYFLINLNPRSLRHVHTQRLKFFLLSHWYLDWYFECLGFPASFLKTSIWIPELSSCHWFLPNFLEPCANISLDPPPLLSAGLL